MVTAKCSQRAEASLANRIIKCLIETAVFSITDASSASIMSRRLDDEKRVEKA
jgi:adenylate kinase